MRGICRPSLVLWLLVLGLSPALPADDAPANGGDALAWARENIAAGKYAEAEEALRKAGIADATADKMPAAQRLAAAPVFVEALRIQGKVQDARAFCDGLLKATPDDVNVALLKAELDADAGNYKDAREACDRVIAKQPENQRAWALRSIVLRILGDTAALKETADHFFALYESKREYYNSEDVKDPIELAYIGLGFQDEDPKSAFETGFLLAEDLVKARRVAAPEVYLWSARLAHDKYHFGFANERYGILLKMRPRLPDALAGQAAIIYQTMHKLDAVEKLLKDALEVNPNHIESRLLYAAMNLEEDRFEDAKKHIDAALAANPNHPRALAMLAFYHVDMAEPDKAAEAEKRALAVNPKCADFYCEVGAMMENKRGFKDAPAWYEKAIACDPQYWRGYFGLGMSTSRQGAHGEEKAKQLLNTAFKKNKFNIWAKNMLVALDSLVGARESLGDPGSMKPVYAESKTAHFTLKFHGQEATVVRPYLEEWAEAAYARQVKLFGFEPQGPLTIELCYSMREQAARTVGLPDLGALGVCFGKLCTVVSPREGKGMPRLFNWRKVLEHEFGHVMALQLAEFRMPRWYTEALSTWLEDDQRVEADRMMIEYIARGKLKGLGEMNEYFRSNPLMAYVHGRYVIAYLEKNFGFEAIVKALKLFAQGKKQNDVLPAVTGKTLKELDEGQAAFVKDVFSKVKMRPAADPASLVQLELAAKKEDATAQDIANLAAAKLALRQMAAAEELARKALEKDARCVDAINILGHAAYERRDYEGARQQFLKSTGIDPDRSFAAWQRLGLIYKKEGKTTKAIEAFEAARKVYPRYAGPENPHHELPALYADLEPPQLDKALAVWRDAVKNDPDDAEAAQKGLLLATTMKDYKAAAEFAQAYVEVDPYKPEVHCLFGQACRELKDFARAAREYQVATALNDKDVESWIGLARAHQALGQREAALTAVQKALDVDGMCPAAKALRDELR